MAFLCRFGSLASLQLQPLGVFWPNPCQKKITEWTGSMNEISSKKRTKYLNLELFRLFLLIFCYLRPSKWLIQYSGPYFFVLSTLLHFTVAKFLDNSWLGRKNFIIFHQFFIWSKTSHFKTLFGSHGSLASALVQLLAVFLAKPMSTHSNWVNWINDWNFLWDIT